MQCNVWKHFHLYQSTVKSMSFSTLAVIPALFAVSFVPWILWFFYSFKMCFWSKTEQTSKNTLQTMLRAFSILCSSRRTFILVPETLGHLHLQSKIRETRLRSNQMIFFFFFCWKEMFLHNEKHCMYCPRCRHFYKSEFRFHSLLAHFIICIFLLYRLNIFYVNSWPFLPPCEQYWSPQQVMMNNCAPSSPCLRIFCELNAYFLNRNWSPHGLSQCTD